MALATYADQQYIRLMEKISSPEYIAQDQNLAKEQEVLNKQEDRSDSVRIRRELKRHQVAAI